MRTRCSRSPMPPVLLLEPGRAGHFRCRAAGLCTAVLPLLSLSTSYCGASPLARTVRPAASVSSVIFLCTVPSAVPPWLFHVTWSPLFWSLVMAAPLLGRGVVLPLPLLAAQHTSPERNAVSPLRAMAGRHQ